ncbi:hypothetical protein [Actinoplanes sp. NPDC023714]|uniref:hypothetical protein n=1 Tax=Actinoplanes sp. NPDC023714 TaxID=3154322 RepID=UPI0033DFC023
MPAHISRLDGGLVVSIAIVSLAVGAALQPKVDLPWDRDGPPAATRHRTTQWVRAQQSAQEKQDYRKALTSRIVKERVEQEADGVADQTEKIKKRIADRDALLIVLEARRDAAVAEQITADSAVRVAAEKVRKSERAAADRLAWLARGSRAVLALLAWAVLVLALTLGRFRDVRTRFVAAGSLIALAIMLVAVSLGWVAAAVILLGLPVGWILWPEGKHG